MSALHDFLVELAADPIGAALEADEARVLRAERWLHDALAPERARLIAPHLPALLFLRWRIASGRLAPGA